MFYLLPWNAMEQNPIFHQKKPLSTPMLHRKMSQILPSPLPHQFSDQTPDLTEKMLCNPDYSTRNISRRGIRPREVRPRES